LQSHWLKYCEPPFLRAIAGDNAVTAQQKCPSLQLPHVRVITADGVSQQGINSAQLREKSKVRAHSLFC